MGKTRDLSEAERRFFNRVRDVIVEEAAAAGLTIAEMTALVSTISAQYAAYSLVDLDDALLEKLLELATTNYRIGFKAVEAERKIGRVRGYA